MTLPHATEIQVERFRTVAPKIRNGSTLLFVIGSEAIVRDRLMSSKLYIVNEHINKGHRPTICKRIDLRSHDTTSFTGLVEGKF